MKLIKSFLSRLLGQPAYLNLTGSLFFLYYKMGWLKNNPSYYNHYFVKHLVKQGDVVIDIGGNLGYFTRIFSKLAGPQGKVLAVEPVALYRKLLEKNVARCTNVTILPYALGEAEGEIQMGNPSADKHRHGLMRVLKKEETIQFNTAETYTVHMKTPMHLFSNLLIVNYIKCDIEGYEIPVIPLMRPLIEKQRPVMQIETDGENKEKLMQFFQELQYQAYYVEKDKLLPLINTNQALYGDIIFIPSEKSI